MTWGGTLTGIMVGFFESPKCSRLLYFLFLFFKKTRETYYSIPLPFLILPLLLSYHLSLSP